MLFRSREMFLVGTAFVMSLIPYFLIYFLVESGSFGKVGLLEWFESEGGKVQGVALHDFDYDGMKVRGLIALRDIAADTVVISCPKHLMLTPVDQELSGYTLHRQDFALAVFKHVFLLFHSSSLVFRSGFRKKGVLGRGLAGRRTSNICRVLTNTENSILSMPQRRSCYYFKSFRWCRAFWRFD